MTDMLWSAAYDCIGSGLPMNRNVCPVCGFVAPKNSLNQWRHPALTPRHRMWTTTAAATKEDDRG